MSHYEFQSLVFLANIDPGNFGGHNHLVSSVQYQGIRKNDGYEPTTTASARREIEKKRKYRKRNLESGKV